MYKSIMYCITLLCFDNIPGSLVLTAPLGEETASAELIATGN